jgi:superkiller protein 3
MNTAGHPVRAARLARVFAEVDVLLRRSAGHYPAALPASHPDRLRDIEPPDDGPAGLAAWSEYAATPAAGCERAVRHLCAVGRDHARALLVSECLGDAIISAAERERLISRAIGVLPAAEEDIFRELLAEPALAPRAVAGEPADLLAAVAAIGRQYRPATALAWGMLILAGNRVPEQLLESARKLDRLALRVTSSPPVVQALDRAAACFDARRRPDFAAGGDSCFQARFGVLIAVRDQLWALKPRRVSTPFLLPQVLDCYLGREAEVGNSLGLGLVDAIILGKLGFAVNFQSEDGTIRLEVDVEQRGVAWDVVRPSPLSFAPVGAARRLSPAELFGLAWSSLGAAHFAHGRLDRAIEQYQRAAAVVPRAAETWNNLANCWLRRQQPDRAIECIERAIELKPDFAEAHACLGNAWSVLERWPRAVDAYKRAISIRPDYVEVYNNLGYAFQHAGNAGQAIAAYEAAVDIRPDYVQGHFNLGNLALEQQRYDDAIRHYREAVRLQPGLAQAWYNLGQAQYGKGRLDDALTSYRRAIEANPKHFGAWHNLGIVYRDKGQKDKAVEAIEQAVAINPNLMR